jgi:hypothetical protein
LSLPPRTLPAASPCRSHKDSTLKRRPCGRAAVRPSAVKRPFCRGRAAVRPYCRALPCGRFAAPPCGIACRAAKTETRHSLLAQNAAIIGGGGGGSKWRRACQRWCGCAPRGTRRAVARVGVDLAMWFSGQRIAAACLATSARSYTKAARMGASDLVTIPLGPQKCRPPSSPVTVAIIMSADKCFGRALRPLSVIVLIAIKIPKNEDMLESIRFSLSEILVWKCGFVLRPSSPES